MYLGKRFDSVSADRVARLVTELLYSRSRGDVVSLELLQKVSKLPKRIRLSIERLGLTTRILDLTLEEFFGRFSKTKEKLKRKTQKFYEDWYKRFYCYFGEEVMVSTITSEVAKTFSEYCDDNLSPCTMYRGLGACRSMFKMAVSLRIVTENPFEGIKLGERKNESRQFYVTRELIDKVLEHCNDDRDRLIIVLARFAGLRVPSEIASLRFCDFANDVIRVHEETKTGSRDVPLFKEVRQIFERLTGEPSELVFPGTYSSEWYPWCMLSDTIARAGLKRWQKLFVNMRSSCITDLDDLGYNEKTLDAIFGNSAEVRKIHYLQLQKEKAYKKVLADNEAISYNKDISSNDIESNIENLLSCKNLLSLRDFLVSYFGTGLS
ncbi:MAG: phage integrase SAM-like domain-containing protein [Planctomycetaceae bacterium]|nr:phage integrase SAM-like domain-containing protein [Planctomycetaceae bacterium]